MIRRLFDIVRQAGAMTMNSSPPKRQAVSSSRMMARRRLAT